MSMKGVTRRLFIFLLVLLLIFLVLDLATTVINGCSENVCMETPLLNLIPTLK